MTGVNLRPFSRPCEQAEQYLSNCDDRMFLQKYANIYTFLKTLFGLDTFMADCTIKVIKWTSSFTAIERTFSSPKRSIHPDLLKRISTFSLWTCLGRTRKVLPRHTNHASSKVFILNVSAKRSLITAKWWFSWLCLGTQSG